MPARRIAILSDVHGHLQSLTAVLADAEASGAQEIVVAGDVVNFGPNSAEVVDLLRERGARLIRGNHEVELVATYDTPALPERVRTSPSFAITRYALDSLGAERRAFLAALPDRLLLDEETVVAHGSPRHVRDAVTDAKSDAELAEMLRRDEGKVGSGSGTREERKGSAGRQEIGGSQVSDGNENAWRLAFVGHTHRPLIRDLPGRSGEDGAPGVPARRFVNVGSAGFNLDGDTRVAYALAERAASGAPGEWRVEIRRVPYDVDAAVDAFEQGMRDACGPFVDLFIRQVRTGHNYFGPWLRSAAGLPDEALLPSVERFLAEHP